MIELDDTVMGYPLRDLIVVAEMLRNHDIDELDLKNSSEMYVMGYKDGQAFVGSTIKKTMDGYMAELTFGKPFASLDKFHEGD